MNHRRKVLMVDDEEQFRETTKKILNRRGFETILAGSGQEALEKLEMNPDVIILDVKMPGMDGHQTLNEIKKIAPDIPVIFLTGHGSLPSAQEAYVSGAFDYLAKPCDIDLLTAKIADACEQGKKGGVAEEKRAMDVMIPIEDYTTLNGDQTIRDAIMKIRESFTSKISTSRIMETGHRSVFILDHKKEVIGILAITDLLEAIMPGYLKAPKPSMADSIQYSPMFWRGMFRREVRGLAKRKISEIMSPAPLTIHGKSNLMEASYKMLSNNARRLAVVYEGKLVGVIREQELFFELEKILRDQK